jgi:hypothetical protein
MIRPLYFHHRFLVLIAFVAIWGLGPAAPAEQPPTAPAAESKSTSAPRPKPQVIYHLPRTSTYAATLHSQAKGQSNALPIDSSMPTSLQISREAANARAQEEPSPSPSSAKSAEAAQKSTLRRSKMQSNRPHVRTHPSPKSRGPGNSRGNKSHKK